MSVLSPIRQPATAWLASLALLSPATAIPVQGRAQDTVTTVAPSESSRPARASADTTGADVVVIYPDSLPEMPRTMSELLAARVAGLFVQRSTGAAGASSWISMRDAGAVQALEPLAVVDGVRRASTPPAFSVFGVSSITLSGERLVPSGIDDIPVDQVERVEILRGPAAAARYGRDGRYGVILVVTRHPVPGALRVRTSLTGGVGSERAAFPSNFVRLDASGNTCTSADAVAGYCTPVNTSSFSVLRDRSPFESGTRRGARLDASAGLGIASVALGAMHDRAEGVLPMDGADHTAVTARALVPLGSRVRLTAAAQTSLRGVSQPAQGSSMMEIVSGGVYGRPIDCSPSTPCRSDTTSRGYWSGTPEYLATLGTRRRLQHFSEGAVLDMRATPWLTTRSSVSFDGFADHGKRFDGSVPGNPFVSVTTQEDVSRAGRSTLEQEFGATWTALSLQGATTLAVRNDRDRIHESNALEQVSTYNGNVLSAGTWGGSSTRDRRTTARLEHRVAVGDRISAGAGLLWTHQKSSMVSLHLRPTLDAFADASVLVVDPAAATGAVRSLRVRAAAGQISGYDPRVFARIAFIPVFAPPGFTPVYRPLRAERAVEIESGADAQFAPADLRISLTAYRRNDTDPYMSGNIVQPSTGFTIVNAMHRRLTGVELTTSLTVVDIGRFRWTLASELALTGDRVTRWQPPMFIGGGNGALAVVEEGKSFGSWRAAPLTWSDTNGNGIVETSEVTSPTASSELRDAGHSRPTRTAGLQSSVLVFRVLTIGAQLEYLGGHRIMDVASAGRCLVGTCVALNDPAASLEDQARAVAARNGWVNAYLQSGSTVRLRELSVSIASARVATRARAGSVRLTVAGRNLGIWSRYHGLDPETDLMAPGIDGFSGSPYRAIHLPSTRQLTARLTIAY